VLGGIIALQVLLAAMSIEALSAVRAYVGGEALYSKAQKDAQIFLLDYLDSHREADYDSFKAALVVPLGDRAAREELVKPRPDLAVARAGFIAGGNAPQDVGRLIRMFRWFHDSPLMADAVASWTEGDEAIGEIRLLAAAAHTALQRAPGSGDEAATRLRAAAINNRLTALERQFSEQLSATSRTVQWALLGMNLAGALLLGAAGLAFVRQNLRERAAAEHEIHRRQELLEQLLDSTAEGLFGVGLDGRCTFINRSALEMLGYTDPGELVGHDAHALIHRATQDGRPCADPSCRLLAALGGQAATHAPDDWFWHRDGHAVRVEHWSHPMSRDGRLDGMVVTFFDIGERVRAREALRNSEARLAKLIDSVADAVISVDGSGRIVLFNRAAEHIFRTRAGQQIGRRAAALLDGDDGLPACIPTLDAPEPASAIGAVRALRCRRADGEEFPAEMSLSRLETDQGEVVTIILRDVSEQHRARREHEARLALEASDRAKTNFLSRMSHELRTPLNAVLGFARLMMIDKNHPLDDQNQVRIAHIESAGSHLLALVNDVLDLSRVESGDLALSVEAVDVLPVAREALSVVGQLAQDGGVRLDTHAAIDPAAGGRPGDGWVLADRVRLRQVLINLLSNAVKYTGRGAEVRLTLRPAGAAFEIVVADTGSGMTPEQLAHLFEPFNRLGAERSAIEGTGIGLVLTRQLVQLMGGRLQIDSVHREGTTATVTLQRWTGKGTSVDPAEERGPIASAFEGPLDVLYAEDNEVNIELMRQVASLRPQVAFRVAQSGAAALEMVRRDPPDLMLVDMHLGDMTGTELVRLLRADAACGGVHFVALSADALPAQIQAALETGFEQYLTKPIAFTEILRVFDAYSAQRAAFGAEMRTPS
jgi:PAS domain S-box-containing protein